MKINANSLIQDLDLSHWFHILQNHVCLFLSKNCICWFLYLSMAWLSSHGQKRPSTLTWKGKIMCCHYPNLCSEYENNSFLWWAYISRVFEGVESILYCHSPKFTLTQNGNPGMVMFEIILHYLYTMVYSGIFLHHLTIMVLEIFLFWQDMKCLPI